MTGSPIPKDDCTGRAAGRLTRPTNCQLNVLRRLAQDGTASKAALELFLSVETVDWHLRTMRKAYGVRYVPQLMALAFAEGWLTADDVAPVVDTARTAASAKSRTAGRKK